MRKVIVSAIIILAAAIDLSAQQPVASKKDAVKATPQPARTEVATGSDTVLRAEPLAQRIDTAGTHRAQGVPEQRRVAPPNKPK